MKYFVFWQCFVFIISKGCVNWLERDLLQKSVIIKVRILGSISIYKDIMKSLAVCPQIKYKLILGNEVVANKCIGIKAPFTSSSLPLKIKYYHEIITPVRLFLFLDFTKLLKKSLLLPHCFSCLHIKIPYIKDILIYPYHIIWKYCCRVHSNI